MTGGRGYPAASRALLRTMLIDAVDDLVRDRGWAATTMSEVGKSAGVSRQTVYNQFGSRQGLAGAYVQREIETLLIAVENTVRDHADDPHEALRGAFGLFLAMAADEPLITTIVSGASDDGFLALLTGVARSVATGRLSTLITETWPTVQPADAAVLAESLVRLGVSHAAVPTAAPQMTAVEIGRLLGPFVDEAVGGTAGPVAGK